MTNQIVSQIAAPIAHPKVVGIGEFLWDMLPRGKRAGGAPVNFVYHATHSGASGCAISAVGTDKLGTQLEQSAKDHDIEVFLEKNGWPTSTVEVRLDEGIPAYDIVHDVAWDHLDYTDELRDIVHRADAVCFGTLGLRSPQSRTTILRLLQETSPTAMKFYDINIRGNDYSKELVEQLLSVATVLKINDDELNLLDELFSIPPHISTPRHHTPDDNAQRGERNKQIAQCQWLLTTFHLDIVILTAGSEFSFVLFKDGEQSLIETPRVDVVDTVGAGDVFSGVFVTRILQGATLLQAHRKAVDVAAFVCTQEGAWASEE